MSFHLVGPKINEQSAKKEGFSGWLKCTGCSELIHAEELAERLNCCPKCDYHFRISISERLKLLSDEGTLEELFTELKTSDPLSFIDTEPYLERVKKAQEKTGRDEAVLVGQCQISGTRAMLAILDFGFMGGSMGTVVGERLTKAIEYATDRNLPLVIVSASGGARMQESIFSLMQMAKTAGALARLHEKGIPYISVLTDPTTGGVTASFASLGDVILAEPNALIGFAGPRLVEQTTRKKLPPDAQKSEFLMERGMIDLIVPRAHLKKKISFLLNFLMNNQDRFIQSSEMNKSTKYKIKNLFLTR